MGWFLGLIGWFSVAACGGNDDKGVAPGNSAGAAGTIGANGGTSTQAGGVAGMTWVQVGGAQQGGTGGQTQPSVGGVAGATTVLTTVAPEAMGVWYYGWMGGNISYLQIALCDAGRARFLHANGPTDPAPTIREGTYVTSTAQPNRITATFVPGAAIPAEPLVSELEYKAAADSLNRLGASDGYSAEGVRFDPTTRATVTARLSCN